MASRRFRAFAFVGILIILLSSEHSSPVDAHQGLGLKTKRAAFMPSEEDAILQKENNDGGYSGERKGLLFGGRKMLLRQQGADDELLKKKEQAAGVQLDGTYEAKISGEASPAVASPDISNHSSTKKFDDLQAAAFSEVVSLMRRDYKGPERPRRKPPINNHNPTDRP